MLQGMFQSNYWNCCVSASPLNVMLDSAKLRQLDLANQIGPSNSNLDSDIIVQTWSDSNAKLGIGHHQFVSAFSIKSAYLWLKFGQFLINSSKKIIDSSKKFIDSSKNGWLQKDQFLMNINWTFLTYFDLYIGPFNRNGHNQTIGLQKIGSKFW